MTPAVLAAKRARIEYTVHEYSHDPANRAYGEEAVTAMGVAQEQVFKTLLARTEPGGLIVAVVPVAGTLDLKALALACKGKKAMMADPTEAERSTGYVVGGISPLGQRKRLLTVVEQSALELDWIYVSAGRRGLEIRLRPTDLLTLVNGRVAPIARRA